MPENEEFFAELLSEQEKEMESDYERYCDFPNLVDKGNWTNCFNSCVNVIRHYCKNVPIGNYLWELIWPKSKKIEHLPQKTIGKYFVKLYIMGAHRMVVVDEKLPFDRDNNLLFPETAKKELWPAILMSALLKASKKCG